MLYVIAMGQIKMHYAIYRRKNSKVSAEGLNLLLMFNMPNLRVSPRLIRLHRSDNPAYDYMRYIHKQSCWVDASGVTWCGN